MKKVCKNCKYYISLTDFPYCAYPPYYPVLGEDIEYYEVEEQDYCGEFEEKENAETNSSD